MKVTMQMCGVLVLAASSAFALDKEIAGKMMAATERLEVDAKAISATLKSKNAPVDEVHKRVAQMDADLATLRETIRKVEAAEPQMSARDKRDWELLKTKAQLLEVFYTNKKNLVAEDVMKHRSMIRAHADGVALRAIKLRQTAAGLQKS